MKLAEVTYFEFGDRYVMRSQQGERPYQDLEDLLQVMGEMFQRERHVYVPSVKTHGYFRTVAHAPTREDPLGQCIARAYVDVLRITPVAVGLPAPSDWIDGIRKRVTHYNLSGSWEYFETENL